MDRVGGKMETDNDFSDGFEAGFDDGYDNGIQAERESWIKLMDVVAQLIRSEHKPVVLGQAAFC